MRPKTFYSTFVQPWLERRVLWCKLGVDHISLNVPAFKKLNWDLPLRTVLEVKNIGRHSSQRQQLVNSNLKSLHTEAFTTFFKKNVHNKHFSFLQIYNSFYLKLLIITDLFLQFDIKLYTLGNRGNWII